MATVWFDSGGAPATEPEQADEAGDQSAAVRVAGGASELAHLRVRRRAAVVTLESGSSDHPISQGRLRRQTAKIWQLEMADHMGRWQPTPFCGSRDELVEALIGNFGWTLAERV